MIAAVLVGKSLCTDMEHQVHTTESTASDCRELEERNILKGGFLPYICKCYGRNEAGNGI